MENSRSFFELFNSIMGRIGRTSAIEIVSSLSQIIKDRLNEELKSISMRSTDAETYLTKEQILSHIYSNYIDSFLKSNLQSSFNLGDSANNKFFFLIYVLHKLEFKFSSKDIIYFLNEKIKDNSCESSECFLALTTQVEYYSEKKELFKFLINFFVLNKNTLILNDITLPLEMCEIINNNYESCEEFINNKHFYKTLTKIYLHNYQVQEKHISNLKEQVQKIISLLSLSNNNLDLYNSLLLKENKLNRPILTSLFETIMKIDKLPKDLLENILNIEKNNPQSFKQVVNIINYLISKQPAIFINESLINFIATKLNRHKIYDESLLFIIITTFEHWGNNQFNFSEEVLYKIKETFSSSIAFCAVFIVFLYQHSKIPKYFGHELLENLVNNYFLKTTYKPHHTLCRRFVKAIICICNYFYYYYKVNNKESYKDKAITMIKSVSQMVFPLKNDSRINTSDRALINTTIEFNEDESQRSYSVCADSDEGSFISGHNESNSFNFSQSGYNDKSVNDDVNKNESLFEDYYPGKNNENDIYEFLESELHQELRKIIVEYQDIRDLFRTNPIQTIQTDKLIKINILKLWSILVLQEQQEKDLSTFLKQIFDELLLLNIDIEVIAKKIIFSSKPLNSKIIFYNYIKNKLYNKTMIDKENVFKLFQEKFDTVYKDFSNPQRENKKLITRFSSLLLWDSNSSSFKNKIDFYKTRFKVSDEKKQRFIVCIIQQYIQFNSEENRDNNYNLDCLIDLIWQLLDIKEIRNFPTNLNKYINSMKYIYLHLYLLQSFIRNIQNEFYQDAFKQSVEILVTSIKTNNSYHKEIINFFIEALENFANKKENTLYTLCEIPIAFINEYNRTLNQEMIPSYEQIKLIFTEDKGYDISIHPIIEVLSLCVVNEGISFLTEVKQLDDIIRRIEYKNYDNHYFLWKIKHTIESSERLYSSRGNHEMTYIASKKNDLFQQPQNNILEIIVQQAY